MSSVEYVAGLYYQALFDIVVRHLKRLAIPYFIISGLPRQMSAANGSVDDVGVTDFTNPSQTEKLNAHSQQKTPLS